MSKEKKIKENEEFVSSMNQWLQDRDKDLNYSIEQFDKLMITLSSGALIVTIGFVKDIVKITKETDTTFLKIGWFSFAIALTLSLLSHIFSYQSNRFEIKSSREEIKEVESEIKKLKTKKSQLYKSSQLRKWMKYSKVFNFLVNCSNILSFITLISGIIVFIIFINKNV